MGGGFLNGSNKKNGSYNSVYKCAIFKYNCILTYIQIFKAGKWHKTLIIKDSGPQKIKP